MSDPPSPMAKPATNLTSQTNRMSLGERDPEVLRAVSEALRSAKLAVGHDHNREYVKAIQLYKETIDVLETAVISVPEENQQEMFDLASQYRDRIEVLEKSLYKSSKTSLKLQTGNSEDIDYFEDVDYTTMPDPPPSQPLFRPFWLMKVLATTMKDGGHLTPKVYVPKAVWYQSGLKIASINTKMASCLAISEALTRLQKIDMKDTDMVLRELDTFCVQIVQIQNSLAKALYFIPESKEEKSEKKEKRFGSAIKKMSVAVSKGMGRVKGRDKLDDASSYTTTLYELFENSQFLGEWLQEEMLDQPASPVTLKLRRASEFFWVVICAFVTRDLSSSLERFLKKGSEQLDRTYR
eukprot:TRINITY_DN7934_c0_g1_i5.p1 TRINITY_DN7934_c0_g1~~TRINITY_DN7934_c0_g1_i5.p1  ORF type:complete len:352 (-),score=82.24 TRINITY_DN7934_c0_g1_i5:140-1195(-)